MVNRNRYQAKPLDGISRKDFEAFEGVRESGVVNMRNREIVCDLARIDHETYLGIIAGYGKLCEKFPGVRQP